MNAHADDQHLDELLARGYRHLKVPDARGRAAVLSGLDAAAPPAPLPKRAFARRLAWMATAAGLALTAASIALLLPTNAASVYGVEAVPGRLAEVRTILQRGYRLVYDRNHPEAPPQRVPVEYRFERPGKFAMTVYGVSHRPDGPPVVRRFTRACDSQTQSWVFEADKLLVREPVHLLEAWLQTETQVQTAVAFLLGPPEMPYRKIGAQRVRGVLCDVYEGQFEDANDVDGPRTVRKLWLDPATGYPVRRTCDAIERDGTLRRLDEIEEIAVNVPLDEAQFRPEPPAEYQVREAPPAAAPPLDSHYVGAAFGGDAKLETWHGLRIADNAALLVWRRSRPEPPDAGNWLSEMTFALFGDAAGHQARHEWVYLSQSPDAWNWSLVGVAGGSLPDRGGIRLALDTRQLEASIDILPLRFPDEALRHIVEAAGVTTLPAEAPRYTLDDLRRRAEQMLSK